LTIQLKCVETMCLENTQNLSQPLERDWIEQDLEDLQGLAFVYFQDFKPNKL